MKQADRLDEIAQKIEKLAAGKMESTIGTLKNAWQSDNSALYYNKMNRVQEEILEDAADGKKGRSEYPDDGGKYQTGRAAGAGTGKIKNIQVIHGAKITASESYNDKKWRKEKWQKLK